jgi:LPS-assembly protein
MRGFLLTLTLLVALSAPPPAHAQAPSDTPPISAIVGPRPRVEPLYMQADQVIHDTRNSRVIAQGNVEIYYNNYILTADQVVYDRNTNKLIAEGNAQLKDPNGSITRADRFEALDDFRDAFRDSVTDRR